MRILLLFGAVVKLWSIWVINEYKSSHLSNGGGKANEVSSGENRRNKICWLFTNENMKVWYRFPRFQSDSISGCKQASRMPYIQIHGMSVFVAFFSTNNQHPKRSANIQQITNATNQPLEMIALSVCIVEMDATKSCSPSLPFSLFFFCVCNVC